MSTHPPAPSKEGELVAGLRMNQLIQTFFVPRWGAFCLPIPRPLPQEGELVAALRMNQLIQTFFGISGLFIQSNDHPSLSL